MRLSQHNQRRSSLAHRISVEDVVQQAFLDFWSQPQPRARDDRFKVLLTIAYHRYADVARKILGRRWQYPLILSLFEDHGDNEGEHYHGPANVLSSPAEDETSRLDSITLREYLAEEIAANIRSGLTYEEFCGLSTGKVSFAACAQKLRVTRQTMYSRFFRDRKRLRNSPLLQRLFAAHVLTK